MVAAEESIPTNEAPEQPIPEQPIPAQDSDSGPTASVEDPVPEQPTTASDPVDDEDLEAQLAYENLKRSREARKRKRVITIVVAVAVALAVVIWLAIGRMSAPEVDDTFDPLSATSVVYRGDFATTVTANGATEPLSSTIVTPEVEGIIENVQVEEGAHVSVGDVLFTLRNDELDKAVRSADEQIAAAQRTLDAANRAVTEAYNSRQRAWDQANAAQDWSMYDEGSFNAAVASAEAERDNAQAAFEQAQTARTEAQELADKRTVRAPVSGTVVAMNAVDGAGVGSTAGSGSSLSGPLVQISDLTQMKVTVQVNEVDIANIAAGQEALATFSALPGVELAAQVQRIASVATGSGDGGYGGVVTYAVDLLIPNPDPNLKPGMTATVTITTQSAPNALIVPASAVWESADEHYVTLLVDQNTGETRDAAVRIIEQNSSEAAVEGNLEEGDLVLLDAMGGFDVYGEDDMLVSDDMASSAAFDGAVEAV